MSIKYKKPEDISADLTECRPQKAFPSPHVVAEDSDAAGGSATAEVYTESAAAGSVTASPEAASFVYLDVGLWAGSDKWKRSRDFGIIHGPVVLLCTFDTQTGSELGDDEKNEGPHWNADAGGPKQGETEYESTAPDYSNNILELLTHLSTSKKLGKVLVRKQIIAKTKPVSVAKSTVIQGEPIYVVLGDMHIPVADKLDVPGDDGRVQRFGRIDMKPLQVVIDDLIPPSAAAPLDRVKALFKWVEDVEMDPDVQKAIHHDWWGLVAKFAPEILLSPAAAAIHAALGFGSSPVPSALAEFVKVAKKVWDVRDEQGVVHDTMSAEDAKAWFEFYKARPDGKPQADIFEGAGDDFLEFVKLLDSSGQKGRVQFMQLGDMIDYWIGFSSYFQPSSDAYMAVEPNTDIKIVTRAQVKKKAMAYVDLAAWSIENQLNPFAMGAPPDPSSVPVTEDVPAGRCLSNIQHWTQNLFTNTSHGKVLAQALHLLYKMPREPIFLYGNHDNYLGSVSIGSTLPGLLAGALPPDKSVPPTPGGARSTFPQRRASFEADGIYMEHGHQCDSSNGNPVKLIPVQFVIGTDSTQGVFLTQAAFIKPTEIRQFEGTAQGAIAQITKNAGGDPGFGQRFDQIAWAIKQHDTKSPFRVYVMGHTHAPILLDVSIANKARAGAQSLTNKLFAAGADVRLKGSAVVKKGSDQYEAVDIEYVSFPDDASGHINLEDPWGPQRKPISNYPRNNINHVKALAFPVSGATGSTTLYAVPPGAYVARYYPGAADDVFVWQSPPIMMQGVSFDTRQSMFAPGQSIPLRWCVGAGYPSSIKFPARRLFFEVFAKTVTTTDGRERWKFLAQQHAIDDPKSEMLHAHGRTTLKGHTTARMKAFCDIILQAWSEGAIDVPVEPGGKALLPDFYVFFFGLSGDRAVDENADTPVFDVDSIPAFANGADEHFFWQLWLRMRIPIPKDMQPQ